MVKYYIENLDKFLKNIKCEDKAIIKVADKNIIELNTDEDKRALISTIKECEFIGDQDVLDFFKENIPELAKELKNTPIDLNEFKENFRSVFSELPDSVFEDKSIVNILRRILNFIIQKNEINFVIMNIENEKLVYDENYKYRKIYESYYRMIKLNHDIDTYYVFLANSQAILERLILKHFLFNEKKIDRKELSAIYQAINLTGKSLANFRYKLQQLQNNIKEENIFIKRTNIPVPQDYKSEVQKLKGLVLDKIKDVDKRMDKILERKKLIQEKVDKKKGIFSAQDAKNLLWELIKKGLGFI